MKLSEALDYEAAFEAVMAGTANDAQCIEVQAVAHGLRAHLQEADLRAKALPDRRREYLALLSEEERAALTPEEGDPPRLLLDPQTKEVVTPDELAARQKASEAAAEAERLAAEQAAVYAAQREEAAQAARKAAENAALAAAQKEREDTAKMIGEIAARVAAETVAQLLNK